MTRIHPAEQGMVLIEGLIGILIFSIGILGIVGLQAASLRHATDAKYRVDASFIANQTLGLIWADRSDPGSHAVTDQPVAGLPAGRRTVTVDGARITVLITWKLPGEAAVHRHLVVGRIE